MPRGQPGRSTRSRSSDRRLRSKESHERGRGAKRKGNPRYTPKKVRTKSGRLVKRYVLRR